MTAAVVSQPMHFIAVTKIGRSFYNLDNLDESAGKKGYSYFKSAVISKEGDKNELIVLDRRSADTR